MRVILSSRAEKQLRRLDKIGQISVARKIRKISDRKKTVKEEKLKGFKNIYRVRVGYFRIVYRRMSGEVYIVLIGHRRDIYKMLGRLWR